MIRWLLILILGLISNTLLLSQNKERDYLKTIIHLQNDKEIRALVNAAFPYKKKAKDEDEHFYYHIADSLTFVDIGSHLPTEFDEVLGLKAEVFDDFRAYENNYLHASIPGPKISNPQASEMILYAFLSKRIGNIIAIDIDDEPEYPNQRLFRMGASVLIVLLLDEKGNVIKNIVMDKVNNN